jgi:hypothetical protein
MDRTARFSLGPALRRIRERIPTLPTSRSRRTPSASPERRKRIMGCIYIVLSLYLGIAAKNASEREILNQWMETYIPNPKAIRYALESQGLQSILNAEQHEAALQSMLSDELPFLESKTFWIHEDPLWVVVTIPETEETSEQALVFVYTPDAKAPQKWKQESWKPQGKGWVGFSQLLEELARAITKRQAQLKPSSEKLAPARKKLPPRDPREVIY